MVIEAKGQDVLLKDPLFKPYKEEKPEVLLPRDLNWQTPGSYIAQEIVSNPLVRFVGEEIQPDCMQTIIVVDDDPEELVDKLFSIEQEMYKIFIKLRFDVRLRVVPKGEDIEVIRKTVIPYYDRDKSKNIS